MLSYSIHLEPDDNGTFLVTCADFPELTTFGEDRDEALARALDALEEAIAARMDEREGIPVPSRGNDRVAYQPCRQLRLFFIKRCEAKTSARPNWGDVSVGRSPRWTVSMASVKSRAFPVSRSSADRVRDSPAASVKVAGPAQFSWSS